MGRMKAHQCIALIVVTALACSSKDSAEQSADETAADQTAAPPEPSAPGFDAPTAAPEPLALADFPHTALGAEVGQTVFAPGDSSLVKAVSGDERDRGKLSYFVAQITEVGDTESAVKGLGGTYTLPNAYIAPIPAGGEVAVGDIVVTSRHGNDMTRAIVTKAGEAPEASFMRVFPRGDNTAALTPRHYARLSDPWQPGAPIAIRIDGRPELAMVLRVEGDRVLAAGHMGKMLAADMSEIIPLPLAPQVKKGDTVRAAWDTVHFMEGVVEKVEPKLGLVHIRFKAPFDEEVKKIPFGEVTTELLE